MAANNIVLFCAESDRMLRFCEAVVWLWDAGGGSDLFSIWE